MLGEALDLGQVQGAHRDGEFRHVLQMGDAQAPGAHRLDVLGPGVESIPGTEVKTVERCAGHDGTWGVKTEYFDNSMKIGRPVFRMMAEVEPAGAPFHVASDCPIAARHIKQGMGADGARAEKTHPLSLLRKAYGI